MTSDPRINSLLDQANNLFLKKRFSEAISFYEEILHSEPDNISALNNIGYSFSKTKNYEKALSHSDAATHYSNGNITPILMKAYFEILTNKIEQAESTILEISKINSGEAKSKQVENTLDVYKSLISANKSEPL